ncbi:MULTISPECIES: T9SS type B sorting domain-containing protein [Flavobacterium]|uniref:T9SS type B sorting domain-containing protein n=1 Tax=Flavobacterium jumunjinense TaxID=998845 RepID=A0ABV5GJI2_9FLAO|nr:MULTISPECIES: T9SS type B sorting domain-containing protein [Flavobacterium]
MKLLYVLLFLVSTVTVFTQKQTTSIGFIENKGQIIDQKGKENSKVKYLLNTNGLNVQLRANGFSYDVYETKKIPLTKKDKELYTSDPNFDNGVKSPDYSLKYNFHRIDIDFLNSNKNSKLISEEKSSDYDNYYNVAHAPNGITNVHKYQKITYQNIYNNIDVVFFIPKDSTKVVEYNFIVKPGGKVSDIQLKFNGGKTELVDNKIKMNLRFGAMEETLPLSWIENGSSKKEISVNYKRIKKNVYGFEGEVNHSNKIIVIDPVPVRLWGTLYGDKTNNHYSLGTVNNTIDSYGNLYMSGSTSASNSSFATTGAHQNSIPTSQYLCTNGIIVKFDTNGTRLWGTYYGGINYNDIRGIKADSQNNIVITGQTQSPINISTVGSHQENYQANRDAYIVKFNESGVRIWGTYFGGNNDDFALDLDIDNLNNIYIVGGTSSVSGIAYNSNFQSQLFQSSSSYGDAFIAKFDSTGTIIWSTYAGGESFESFNAVVIKDDHVVAVGYTRSETNIATSGVFQQTKYPNGQIDGIIYKFSNNGNRLWSSYYGGDNIEDILSVEIDDEDNIYIGGQTASSSNMTTTGSFQFSSQELYNGFFAKLSSTGVRLWGSYLNDLNVYSIIYKNNSIYLGATGSSSNQNLTNSCSFNRNLYGESLGYIGKFSKNCNFIWGSFLGGDAMNGGYVIDSATKLSIDNNNNIYVSGITSSNNLISDSSSHQQNMLGLLNYYSMKFLETSPNVINVSSNSPVCVGGTINLTASGGNSYAWTGPNGFTSTDQNPIIPNVTSLNNGQYSCTITGTGGCDDTVTIDIIVGDSEAPIPTITNLPTISGDCNTTIAIPTANDNCTGIINATTTDPINYTTAGNYTITWLYNDGNGNTSNQTQNVVIIAVPLPIINSPQQFCIQDNATINDIQITGQNITWYDAQTAGTVLLTSTLLQNGVTYYASQTINGCESERVPVSVTLQNTAAPTGNVNQSFCSTANATLNEIIIAGSSITWYENLNGNSVLPNTTTLVDGTTYYATQTINSCESINRLAITISLINTLNATDYSESLCDDLNNGFEIINLTNYNTNLITSTGNTFSYYNSLNGAENLITSDKITNPTNYNLSLGNHIIYVRIDSPNTCHQVVTLDFTLYSKPFLNINDIMPICEGASITISAGNGFDDYLWSTGEITSSITVFQSGNYSVTVSENHGSLVCSSTKNFSVVNSNIGTITQIISSDWTANENTISVLLSSNSDGNYEYSLDGITYQNSPIFNGLPNGEYTVYVNDKNGCGEVKEDVYLLMYPKFFTPNGDGYNDFWKIKFSENEPHLTVTIFDRYGKFIKQFGSSSQGWDGNYLGEQLPSTDYWFLVTRENGKEFKGHFTLKR